MSTKKIKNKEPTLQQELSLLNISYKIARSKIQYNKAARNYKAMAECFGVKSDCDRAIWLKDLDIFKSQIEQIIKDKYACRRFIEERARNHGTISSEPNEDNDRNSGEETSVEVYQQTNSGKNAKHKETPQSTWVARYQDQKAELMIKHCNQQKTAKELWDNFSLHNQVGQLLLAATGSGKTYILANFLKNFIEQGYVKKLKCKSPWPIVYITKVSIVPQTKLEVLKRKFNIDTANAVKVINIETLRSEFGRLFVKETIEIKNGQEHVVYKWNEIHPCLFIWDECQILAREDSIQSKIALAATEIWEQFNEPAIHIFASATPGARVAEFKVACCATRRTFDYGMQKVLVTRDSWTNFAKEIAAPSDPYEYSTAAVGRLIDWLEPNIRRITGIRSKHKAFNSTCRLQFQTRAEREEYDLAWIKYLEKKQKIENDSSLSEAQARFCILAQFTIFRKAAEKIRRYHLARFANDTWNAGEAPAMACAFKGTITSVVKILIEDYNWSRDDISIIWGGATESLTSKQKLNKKIKDSNLESILKNMGLSLDEIGVDIDENETFKQKTNEQLQFEKAHRLLGQSPQERESERLRFQRQDSKLLIFTYKAGGVGLSAHHEGDENYKPIYPKARPRRGMFTPVYSEKELIQGFGRLPRITSASDTFQSMCYYADTIEVEVASRVIMKLKCMKEVVRAREHWEDIITGRPAEIEDEEEFEGGDNGIEATYIEEKV